MRLQRNFAQIFSGQAYQLKIGKDRVETPTLAAKGFGLEQRLG
jgi:hypothetical protein